MELLCTQCGTVLRARVEPQPNGVAVDGRQRQVCPSCGWVAYEQLKVGASVLVEREGKVLLVLRSRDSAAFPRTWNLPAAYCEADEAPRVAAAREAAEETGLQVHVVRLVDAYFFDDDPRGNGVLLVYRARIEGEGPEGDHWPPPRSAEVEACAFFSPDQLPEAICGGGHDQAILAWRAQARTRWEAGMEMRFCPHCTNPLMDGMAFGRLRQVCHVCGFVHFRAPKVGVSVLVEQDRRVLLVRRGVEPGRGLWSLPSGFVEWDEEPEGAAVRECEEETGLRVTDLQLMTVGQYTDDFRGPGIDFTYRARVSAGSLQPGDDALLAQFFSRAELPSAEYIAFSRHRTVLEEWRAQSRPG